MVIAGGTGFIGAALARRFRERGAEVVVLTRSTPRRRGDGVREVPWEPAAECNPIDDTAARPTWWGEIEGAHALINLAGSSIDCVHTAENRQRILASRLDAVRALGAAARACATPPTVWAQASAVGIYGDTERRCAEDASADAGTDFLADVCRQWEAAFAAECPPAVRGVVLRIGVVLGRKGGAYPPLARATKAFLGGRAGSGRQGISWVLLDDLEEIFLRAVNDDAMRGTYNACAPEPVGNAEFMRTLREVLGRPWAPPAPAFAIRLVAPLVLKTDPSLILEGQYAVPARLLAEGFRFKAPRLVSALTALAD
ncbi:MAG: TIGR01777 family protein [Opitutae bacterium]|nr:TIGR01777 family protein [Opitutae bacterium]